MTILPPAVTPLNQHSIAALEAWLEELGAVKRDADPCLWDWAMPEWSAVIKLSVEELKVTWNKQGSQKKLSFPYGLSRHDIEAAMILGP